MFGAASILWRIFIKKPIFKKVCFTLQQAEMRSQILYIMLGRNEQFRKIVVC